MFRQMKRFIALCAIGAVVAIAAFAFDSKEDGAAAQADAARTEQTFEDLCGGKQWEQTGADPDTQACLRSCYSNLEGEEDVAADQDIAHRWSCPMEQVAVEHNAIPRAFADKPVLGSLLAKVHADLMHPDAIRAAIILAAMDVKEPRMVEFLTECGLPKDSHYGEGGIRLFLPCLTDAARSLADFRAAAEQKQTSACNASPVIARLVLVVPPSLHSVSYGDDNVPYRGK